jgi:hypothetical protein
MIQKISSFIIYFFFFSLSKPLLPQIALTEWRDHLPYSHGIKLAATSDKIFCATESAVFSYNKNDNSIEKFSKVSGFSDVGISTIKYSYEYQILLIAYTNTNIDLIENNKTIYNLSDIKRKQISGLKTINNVIFIDQFAYLSCGFGIVVINLEKKEIKETYYIGENGAQIDVHELAFDGIYLYAATEHGIYKANINNPNLIYYSSWNLMTDLPNYQKNFNAVTIFNTKLIVNHSDRNSNTDILYVYDGSNWSAFDTYQGIQNYSINSCTNRLVIASDSLIRIYNENLEEINKINNYGWSVPHAHYALVDQTNTLWIADSEAGITKTSDYVNFDSFIPNGPYNNDVFSISIEAGNLVLAGGGLDGAWSNIYKPGELYSFRNEQWSSIIDYSIRDVVRVLVDPANPNVFYAASWGYGIFQYENGKQVNHFDDSNSTLESIIEGEDFIRVGGLAFDSKHNLWVTNSGVESPISVRKYDGSWKNFPYGSIVNAPTISDIIVTRNDHKWVVLPRGYGLFVFDNNGTIDDTTDDRVNKFSLVDQDGKTYNNIFSIAEDLEGNIWVGTSEGPFIYYNPENVFSDQSFSAYRIKIPRDDGSGLADYMLGTETITAIAVDGANRKWIGTENAGIFLLSTDGTSQICSFNENNSPIFSNHTISIAIDHQSGEVFFGTEKGVISYRSTATYGTEEFNNVFVFPNPVREDYNGLITVTGLASNADIKITDISGNIVYETKALGGQAIWNGRNFSGVRVHTGVYLIFCTNEDGSKTYVTKLLFIH